jgi:hypothetical protein
LQGSTTLNSSRPGLRLTFFVSSDGAIREPPKKHSDFWDLIFNLLWAEMTRFHLLTTLFHHNDYPARRLSSDWK